MRWPASRFDALYKAMVQRQAVESIEAQRAQMIAALYSNPNWDEEKADREARIQELNQNFNEAIELVYYPEKREKEIDWSNPFYAAAKRGLEKTREKYGMDDPERKMGELVQVEIDKDQSEARQKSRKGIDQI